MLLMCVPFNAVEKEFPIQPCERINLLLKIQEKKKMYVLGKLGLLSLTYVPFSQKWVAACYHFFTATSGNVGMWVSLPSFRCFANISLPGQATDSICAQLNPHKIVSLTNDCFFPFQPREMPGWAIFTFGGKCSI